MSDGYGSNRGDFVDIAGNPVTTPDTRPRCDDVMRGTAGGINCELAVGHDGPHEWNNEHGGYRWPNRTQAAPTPSGTSLAELAEARQTAWRYIERHTPSLGHYRDATDRYYEAALKEARDGFDTVVGEAVVAWGAPIIARADAAEQRLREVEDERDRLRAAADALSPFAVKRVGIGAGWAYSVCYIGDGDPLDERGLVALDDALISLRAASRPVPASRVEITDTYGMRETFTDGSRPATPSTDEEGR